MPSDIHIFIPDIKGESLIAGHEEEIQLLSFDWGVSQLAGSVNTVSSCNITDLSISKLYCRASPVLMTACTTARKIDEIKLTVAKAGGNRLVYLTAIMKEAIISNMHINLQSSDESGVVHESVSIRFEEIEITYQQQGTDGDPLGGEVMTSYLIPSADLE